MVSMSGRAWWLLIGTGFLGLMGCGHSGTSVGSPSAAAMAPVAEVREIHVNQECLILQDRVDGVAGVSVPGAQAVSGGKTGANGQTATAQTDPAVCHLVSQFTSNHVKGVVVNGAVQRTVVVVKEQEYLLQNEFQTPVVFVVEQVVPDGWKVDSVPQPTKMVGKVALFRENAEPGQIVRLHVGEAHEIALAE